MANAHCLASIKMVGLVYVRRRKPRDRKIVGINIDLSVSGDWIKFFDHKIRPSLGPKNINKYDQLDSNNT